MLKNTIKEDLKTAMREHNDIAKNTLKGALSAFTNELVAMGKTPRDELSTDEELKVLKRMEKQRKDAIQKYTEGGRDDLAENEVSELKVLEKYLPKMMSETEILKITKAKKDELQITDVSKMGILVGAVMKETSGQADGADVKNAVTSLFD